MEGQQFSVPAHASINSPKDSDSNKNILEPEIPKFEHCLVAQYDHQTRKKYINQYCLEKTLGQGVHGTVKLATDTKTNKCYAIKIIPKSSNGVRRLQSFAGIPRKYSLRFDIDSLIRVKREISILNKTHHPNIIKLFQVIDDAKAKRLFLVMEWAQLGEINWRSKKGNTPLLNYSQVHKIFVDLVSGVEHLHSLGIIHRDIKPANILLDAAGNVKISDFGVSFMGPTWKVYSTQLKYNLSNVTTRNLDDSTNAKTSNLPETISNLPFKPSIVNAKPKNAKSSAKNSSFFRLSKKLGFFFKKNKPPANQDSANSFFEKSQSPEFPVLLDKKNKNKSRAFSLSFKHQPIISVTSTNKTIQKSATTANDTSQIGITKTDVIKLNQNTEIRNESSKPSSSNKGVFADHSESDDYSAGCISNSDIDLSDTDEFISITSSPRDSQSSHSTNDGNYKRKNSSFGKIPVANEHENHLGNFNPKTIEFELDRNFSFGGEKIETSFFMSSESESPEVDKNRVSAKNCQDRGTLEKLFGDLSKVDNIKELYRTVGTPAFFAPELCCNLKELAESISGGLKNRNLYYTAEDFEALLHADPEQHNLVGSSRATFLNGNYTTGTTTAKKIDEKTVQDKTSLISVNSRRIGTSIDNLVPPNYYEGEPSPDTCDKDARVLEFGINRSKREILHGSVPDSANHGTGYSTPDDISGIPKKIQHTVKPRPHYITPGIDIWATGVTLYALSFGQLPFTASNEYELFGVVTHHTPQIPPELAEQNSNNYYKSSPNPSLKTPIHPLSALYDILKKMLDKDFSNRITIAEIKNHDYFHLTSTSASSSETKIPPVLDHTKRNTIATTKPSVQFENDNNLQIVKPDHRFSFIKSISQALNVNQQKA